MNVQRAQHFIGQVNVKKHLFCTKITPGVVKKVNCPLVAHKKRFGGCETKNTKKNGHKSTLDAQKCLNGCRSRLNIEDLIKSRV